MLAYEEALTRDLAVPDKVPDSAELPITAHYNTGAHFLWIGDRTRQLSGAHVEYFRGIRNPIGIKVGPSMAADEVPALLDSEYSLFLLMPCTSLPKADYFLSVFVASLLINLRSSCKPR